MCVVLQPFMLLLVLLLLLLFNMHVVFSDLRASACVWRESH